MDFYSRFLAWRSFRARVGLSDDDCEQSDNCDLSKLRSATAPISRPHVPMELVLSPTLVLTPKAEFVDFLEKIYPT